MLAPCSALAATITVNSAVDTTANDGVCTLREAIIAAQTNTASGAAAGECVAGTAGLDTIVFAIPGAGVHTIQPTTRLMAKTPVGEPLTIDGYTQPGATPNSLAVGNNAVLLIEIDGTSMGPGEFLFVFGDFPIAGGNTTIRGLVINRMPATAFLIGAGFIGDSPGNAITGNFIGTDPTGTTALFGADNTPIVINGTGTSGNVIGGVTADRRNLIVGGPTGLSGQIVIQAPSNVVQGNYMGTNAAGTAALGSNDSGIALGGVKASGNLIGGTAAGAGNVIVGAGGDLIILATASNTIIQGNLIGTNATGTAALAGAAIGIVTSNSPSNTTIGGSTPGARNVISGNTSGIVLQDGATATTIQGNFIGTDISGAAPIPNTSHGIVVATAPSGGTIIGGTGAGQGNTIAFNGGAGVFLFSAPSFVGYGILGNSIFGNGQLGIALDGSTVPLPNDAGDADMGTNNFQNYPVITSAVVAAGNATISGTLNSTASTTFRAEFFASAVCDPSGFGEGQTFIGFTNVTTDGAGNASFGPLVFAVPAGQSVITSTATDPANNTSEFSACLVAPPLPTLSINNVSANEGNSGTTAFTFTVTLSAASVSPVTVNYATADGTAVAPGDYASTSGTLTFNPGITTQPITVNVNGDATVEPNETFTVILTVPTNATIATSTGTGTIVNDDAAALPTLSINNVTANEGNGGTTAFTFTVTLSAASASPVTVAYATADGTAVAPGDYASTSGTLTFNPGLTTQPITVNVNGDATVEPNETFTVNLSAPTNATIATGAGTGTIVNDDAAPPPPTTAIIPTLSEWTLVLLAAMVLVIAVTRLRKRAG